MSLAAALDDPSMLPTCENCHADDIGVTIGTDVILCVECSERAQKIMSFWPGWPPKVLSSPTGGTPAPSRRAARGSRTRGNAGDHPAS